MQSEEKKAIQSTEIRCCWKGCDKKPKWRPSISFWPKGIPWGATQPATLEMDSFLCDKHKLCTPIIQIATRQVWKELTEQCRANGLREPDITSAQMLFMLIEDEAVKQNVPVIRTGGNHGDSQVPH